MFSPQWAWVWSLVWEVRPGKPERSEQNKKSPETNKRKQKGEVKIRASLEREAEMKINNVNYTIALRVKLLLRTWNHQSRNLPSGDYHPKTKRHVDIHWTFFPPYNENLEIPVSNRSGLVMKNYDRFIQWMLRGQKHDVVEEHLVKL